MSSKWRPWDFLKHHPKVINTNRKGLSIVYCTDPFVERILRNKLDLTSPSGEGAIYVSGMELSVDWIKDNLQTLSLFGGDQSVCILQGNSITPTVKKYLLENEISDEARDVVFFLNGDKKFFNTWGKNSKGDFLEVEEPKFWETGKLLTYFADEMSMKLPMDIHSYLLEAVPHNSGEFINTLKTIRLSFGTGPYKVSQIKAVIPATRLDQFRLASILGKKSFVEFFKELERLNLEQDEQISFFNFLQSHLLKIMDPSYIANKARPSKYDKEIQAHSALWKRNEAQHFIRKFSRLEIEAKKKNPYLKSKVREFLLEEL